MTLTARAAEIYRHDLEQQRRMVSRLFAVLMGLQWAACVALALIVSPLTWIGEQHRVHEHVWIAVIMGGVLAALPVALALTRPHHWVTRHVVAVAQPLFSALLIHLSGGRVETHFHVFGSLAFLAFYRDWRVLLTATVVVAADHAWRGALWPQSVFGVANASQWRWLEHAGWVVFEDIVLVASCVRGLTELRGIAERQASLEAGKSVIEEEVRLRTQQLQSTNDALSTNRDALRSANEGLKKAAAEHEELHRQLLAASREAGMAEVATGVLHNVGNVLNSVNVATRVLNDKLRGSEVASLAKASELLKEHRADLGRFLSADERGRHLPEFLIEVARCLSEEQTAMLHELDTVVQGVEHVKHVVGMQQEHAKRVLLVEMVRPTELMETALQMQRESLTRHEVKVERRFEAIGAVPLDKHRVMQILVNLISNAKRALSGRSDKRLTLTIAAERAGSAVRFEVSDNGVGIPAENLNRIFAHGFTTRNDGHGFGLHSAANAAKEMDGMLTATSDGAEQGATFVLVVPIATGAGSGHESTARQAAAG